MTALAPFNPDIHHVGLGPWDSEEPFGFLLSGGYTRSGQQFGQPTEFGGQAELISTPTLSRWVQDDFTGGAYQYTWGKDPAMFAASTNLIPSQFDRSVRTCPPLARALTTMNGLNLGARKPLLQISVDGYLVIVFTCGTAKVRLSDGQIDVYGDSINGFGAADWIKAACFDPDKREIIWNWVNPGTGASGCERLKVPEWTRPYNGSNDEYNTFPEPPNGSGRHITKMAFVGGLLIAQSGARVWSIDLPEKSGESQTWTPLGRITGQWRDQLLFNGALYILCSNANDGTKLVTVDPKLIGSAVTSVLPVAEFPYNFRGDSLCTIGGRVYVGGSGTDISGGDSYAELYEVTASSVRLVRTFAPESRAANLSHRPKTIHAMVAHEGLLFWGDKGWGLCAYDLTTDSLYGSSRFAAPDGQKEVWSLTSARDTIWAYVTNPVNGADNGVYKVAQVGDPVVPAYDGWLITSDFGPESDRNKRWSQAKVMTRYGGCTLGYSLDGGAPGGDTFHPLTRVSEEVRGDRIISTFDLAEVPASAQIRLRVILPRGTDVSAFTELVALTVSFAFLDSGRWAWSFTINGTARMEGSDGISTVLQDVHDVGDELRSYWRDQVPLRYRDTDGQTYRVTVRSFQESQPIVGPDHRFTDLNGDTSVSKEAFYSLTLLET